MSFKIWTFPCRYREINQNSPLCTNRTLFPTICAVSVPSRHGHGWKMPSERSEVKSIDKHWDTSIRALAIAVDDCCMLFETNHVQNVINQITIFAIEKWFILNHCGNSEFASHRFHCLHIYTNELYTHNYRWRHQAHRSLNHCVRHRMAENVICMHVNAQVHWLDND